MVKYVQRLAAVSFILGTAVIAGAAAAQSTQQTSEDAWVGSSNALWQVGYDGSKLVSQPEDTGDNLQNLRAMAFDLPDLTKPNGRRLLVVDGNGATIQRYEEQSGVLSPTQSLDASADQPGEPDLQFVNTVALAENGWVLFTGYSKPKRVFELWASKNFPSALESQVSGVPQIVDAVYVNARGSRRSSTGSRRRCCRRPAGALLSGSDNLRPELRQDDQFV